MMEESCIVCRGSAHRKYHTKKSFDVWECTLCGLLRLWPLPMPEDLERCYGAGYFTGDASCDGYMDYDFEKEVMRRTMEHHLDMIERHVPRGSLFEVGAATGYFLSLAQVRGWHVAGVDISAYAASKAAAKGLPIRQGGTEVLAHSDARYDAIVLFDVIEHFLYPTEDVRRMVNALRLGGVLVFATPNRGSMFARLMGRYWHAIVPPQHVFLFSDHHLEDFLGRFGLEVVTVESTGKWFTVQYLFRVLYTWLGWRPLYTLAESVANTRLGRLSFPLNLRDTMFVVARKRPLANTENAVVP
ncbi:MAG: class I SAM-dependent methyltransferase [Patescibacteria group bacterium]